MYCNRCGELIPQARLKALPTAKTCVNCSQAQRVAGFPLITGKTEYSALQLVSQADAQQLHEMGARRGTRASTYMKREKRN
ncbi:TraR/DksA family transcriptional regulator [Spirosoma aerophilum]